METAPMTEIETSQDGFSVAPMTADLLPAVVELEKECGLNSRGLESYRKMLSNPKSVLLVALSSINPTSPISPISPVHPENEPSRVIGMFSGDVVVDELQVDNLAVSGRRRRKGIGRTLLKFALAVAAGLGARTATLEVRSANSPARSFYENEGFIPVGLRARYYADPPDDALLLSRNLEES
jgi:[ribosomal protein S18]-alanine N-acetyltransferase